MNQLRKYQKKFLEQTIDSNDSSPADSDRQRQIPDSQKPYIEPITEEESVETEANEVPQGSSDDISFNVDKSDSPAWTNTVQTARPTKTTNSERNLYQLDSYEKQIRWTQNSNKHQSTFLSFIERLNMRECLCVTNESQQQLESMILTMCCKENADLYNNIIQDLQGFGNLRHGSHYTALNAVQQQSERLVIILQRFCETKYEQNQFYQLMYSILQLNNGNSSQSSTEQQMIPERSKQKSFSFEDMSIIKHFQSKDRTNSQLKSKNDSSLHKNVFNVNEQVNQDSRQTQQQESNHTHCSEEQLRSPMSFDEIRMCNEMINQLRVECQEYEVTIVDQQNEIGQLREIISRKANLSQMKNAQLSQIDRLEFESLIKRLSFDIKKLNLEKEQQSLKIAEDCIFNQGLQEQLRELRHKNVDVEKRLDQNNQNQFIQHELETLRHEHHKLKQGFSEIQETCRLKENQLISVEKQAQIMLKQAQKDAEDCIHYFKSLVVKQGSSQNITTGGFNNPTDAFPQSLAPLQFFKRTDHPDQQNVRSPQTIASDKTRSLSMPRPASRLMSPKEKDDFTFNSIIGLRIVDSQLPIRVQVCLEAMSKSFQEVFELKSGLLSYIQQFRDSYCDQVKNFSVQSYDYIDKIQNLILQESTLQTNLKKYEDQVEELRQVTHSQAKHIKAQSELLLLYRDQVRNISETNMKQIKRKEKERTDLIKYVTAELPLLAEGLTATTSQIWTIRIHEKEAYGKLDDLKSLHETTKKKMRLLEDQLDIALKSKKDLEKIYEESRGKYQRITDLIQDVWIAEIQPMSSHKNFTFDKLSMNLEDVASNGTLLSQETVAMPCNWLADLRDYIKQLKEVNDYQKEECYQLLNILNTSAANERSDTDGLIFTEENDSRDEQLSNDQPISGRRSCSGLGTDENAENSYYEEEELISQSAGKTPLRKNMNIQSPRYDKSNRSKFQPNLQRHSQRNKYQFKCPRNNSVGSQQKTQITSQRTPKIVSFSGKIQLSSNCKSPKYGNEKFYQHEIQQTLKNEIQKITRDQKIQKETILQMKLDLKAQRRQIQDQKSQNEQLIQNNEQITARNDEQEDELKDQENNIEQLRNEIQERQECIEMLKTQIEDFEKELESMQQQMGNIVATNQQVSQSNEHLERMHQQVTQEYHHEKSLLQQKITMIQEQFQEKLQTVKGKIFEKELLMQETAKLLEREREFRAGVEVKKLAVSDEGTDTQAWFGQTESQNESLRLQLNQVKDDVKAVLEQYDRELTKSKCRLTKSEKLRETNKQLIDELNQSRVDLDNLSHQLQAINEDYDSLTRAFNEQQQQFQDQISQGNKTNDSLQKQVDSVTQLAEELQEQIFNSTSTNEQLKKQLIIYETRIRELDYRNSEMRVREKQDFELVQKYKTKIEELKGLQQRRQSSWGEQPQNHFSMTHGSKRFQIQEPGFMGQSQHNVNLSANSSPIRNVHGRTNLTNYQQKDSCFIAHENANLSDLMLDETADHMSGRGRGNLRKAQMEKVDRPSSALTGQPTHYCSNHTKTNKNSRGKPSFSPQNNPFNQENSYGEGFDCNLNTMDMRVEAQSCYNTAMTNLASKPTPNSNYVLTSQNDINELKTLAFAKNYSQKKVTKILTYIGDIIKFYCKQQADRHNVLNRNGLNQSSSQHLKNHANEWSSNNLLDCWGTEETDIIAAKAFFGKKAPSILSNLKLLADLTKISQCENDQMIGKHSVDHNMMPVTITSSRIRLQPADVYQNTQDEIQLSSRQDLQHQKSEFMDAYQNLAVHCQKIYMKLAQIGRSLAGICYGGCMMLGDKEIKEHKKNVAYAMNYLAQDTTQLEATSGENLEEIQRVTDSLISCVSQIITVSCFQISKKVDKSVDINSYHGQISARNKKEERVCFSEGIAHVHESGSNLNFVNTFGQNLLHHQLSGSQFVKEKLLDVENRIKQKFNHVSKLEISLEQLLSRSQADIKNLKEHEFNSSLIFADTKTVLKLLQTVKRVISKLKIELHQDFLSLGQINVVIFSTPSNSSRLSQATFEANTPASINLNPGNENNNGTNCERDKAKIVKIIDEMQGLTFSPSLTSGSSGQSSLNV